MTKKEKYLNFSNDIKKIYQIIPDAISKEIYTSRIMHSLTGDYSYIERMAWKHTKLSRDTFLQGILSAKLQGQEIIIFGAGRFGQTVLDWLLLKGIKPFCFIDNDSRKYDLNINGVPVYPPGKIVPKQLEAIYIIGSLVLHVDLTDELFEMGVESSRILIWPQKMYFEDFLPHLKDEIFIDAGGFDGQTSQDFIDWCGGSYKHIHLFEPDASNVELCIANMTSLKVNNITYYNHALYKKKAILRFASSNLSQSRIDGQGDITIKADALDNLLYDQQVTFIKMDIEGSELDALNGAKKIIKKYRPKLAISIYHKPEDIFEIPLYLISLVPDYKFYLRHYMPFDSETVLFAVSSA